MRKKSEHLRRKKREDWGFGQSHYKDLQVGDAEGVEGEFGRQGRRPRELLVVFPMKWEGRFSGER